MQEACGRHQSFEQTQASIQAARDAGVSGVNIDLIYGLPYQTVESVGATALKIASLRPDRLAVFGYAHVPWKQKRQRLIPEASLPKSEERLAQRAEIDRVLQAQGYRPIGLDHYALPEDGLAQAAQAGTLHRNFQGYTTDPCPVLLGMGASAISMLPAGFAQNITSVAAYARAMAENSDSLPVARGVAFTEDDKLRGAIIERIMCDMAVDLAVVGQGCDFSEELAQLHPLEQDGLVKIAGQKLSVTVFGRPFVRHVAAVFDTRRRALQQQAQGAGQGATPQFSAAL